MTTFFISSDNPETDLQRCHESRKFLSRLVITGATEQGEIKLFEGVVQSIEDHGENAPKGRRWRVLMIDEIQRIAACRSCKWHHSQSKPDSSGTRGEF